MTNKLKFISLTLLLFATRFYDMYTTYLYIPDLKGETNVLVSQFSFGWVESLIVQVASLCFISFTLYVYLFKKVSTIEVTNEHSLKEFISIYFFTKPDEFYKLLYRLPSNKNALLSSIGGIVPKSMIIISLVVGSSTSLLILSESYQNLYRTYNLAGVLYAMIVVVIAVMTIRFFQDERSERSRS